MSFLEWFEKQVDTNPSCVAISSGANLLTYEALDRRSNQLARHLAQHEGVGPGAVVALCGERTINTLTALLAILKTGAAYLPLDAHYPAERIRFMLTDSRSSMLLREPGLLEGLELGDIAQIQLSESPSSWHDADTSRLPRRCEPSDLAYVIYTSGSTGVPKAVAMVHQALDNLIEWQLGESAAGQGTTTLQFAPLSFDVHFQEIFSTWCSGGRLVLIKEELRLEPLELLRLIEREHVERLFLPFIALQSLAEIAVTRRKLPLTLREVITAGEQLQVTRSIRELFAQLPNSKLFNHYGPSETHVVTSLLLAGASSTWPDLPSIGHPLPGVELLVVDGEDNLVEAGHEGELLIGGIALARGYLHRPDLTAERFITRAGKRYYRTGDLVKQLPTQDYQFLGRIDGQVKIRGYRVEVGEIEVILAAHPKVTEAAVTVHSAAGGEKRLIAYVVLEDEKALGELRTAIRDQLPEYMMPSAILRLPRLPRTPSGKVDKRALPTPTRARPNLPTALVRPVAGLQATIAAIWSELLELDEIGIDDNFFDLGGNSLLALRAASTIEHRLGQSLPVVQFFEYPTVAQQAKYLEDPAAVMRNGVRRVELTKQHAKEPIAVIGMAGRFPGADSVAQLWHNLCRGMDLVDTFSREELADVDEQERNDPAYVPMRGVLSGIEYFDSSLFGISRAEAAVLDPQQRILLELAWAALEHAGYAPNQSGKVIGVYAGVHNNSYYSSIVQGHPNAASRIGAFATMAANEKDYVATRIANRLNLTGPALSIHTACSTSLVAIATAAQQLRAGMCDMALAGGAALTIPQRQGHVYQEGGMLSRDGRTRAFDAGATGTVFSDGAAFVVLKPLSLALRDRDTIYAIIRGIGLNNDGGNKASFTAPSIEGQAAAIGMALDDAGVSAREIQYVEAHGTATPLGDPIEVEALSQAYARTTKDTGFCGLGSIKSNLGHMTAAAGVGGLIKVVLSLHYEYLVKNLHYSVPNPKIRFETTPFVVLGEGRPWPRGQRPRLAGVSAFGVGGTNAHLVLQEAPAPQPSGPSIAPQLITLSAKSEAALDRVTATLADSLAHSNHDSLADIAFTLAVGRAPFPERRFLVARSLEEAAVGLRTPRAQVNSARARSAPPKLVFLFPGQGSQYVGMGQNLYSTGGVFKLVVDECVERFKSMGLDLRDYILEQPADVSAARELLKRTEFTQPALFTIEYALARQLLEWGIRPSTLVGHSIGEFAAACLSGVFTLEQAVEAVAVRGRLMQSMPPGAMLSVRDSLTNVQSYLPAELDLAADNAPELCVVSGDTDAIAAFARQLETRKIRAQLLETSHAFHSRSMTDAAREFERLLRKFALAPPRIPIISTRSGTRLSDEQAVDPAFWASQLREPVRFAAAISHVTREADAVLVEVGPRKTLCTLALQRPDDQLSPKAVPCLGNSIDNDAEWLAILDAIGRLWLEGVPIDFQAFYRDERRHRVPLPGYSFERERHWLDSTSADTVSNTAVKQSPKPTLAPTRVQPMTAEAHSTNHMRREKLITELRNLFAQTSGSEFATASPTAHFMELGIDSLLITQIALRVKQTYKLPVTFRQLMEETPTLLQLATYLDERLPPDVPQPAQPPAAAPMPASVLQALPNPASSMPAGTQASVDPLGLTQQLIQLQMTQLALLQQMTLTNQMASLAAPATARPIATQVPPPVAFPAASSVATAPASPAPQPQAGVGSMTANDASPTSSVGQVKYDPQKAFGAIARIYKQSDALTPKQQARLAQLTDRYCKKTSQSKAHTQEHRPHHADPRVVTGFKPRIKELIYPIVTARASGARLWDLDGNEYVDALNGFGSNFFGYSPKFITDALHAQVDRGYEIGPQTPLAGQSAQLVCELTGMARAAFCNTGSEAVMGAMRIARTVTGRNLVVAFSGSYHGIFDEVIVRDTTTMRSVPAAPGILPEAVQNILVLEYGTDKSLQVIRERADEIAAVLVEPVQSRRPDFRPQQFLKEVRSITHKSGSALIFDEVITGFRVHPGGAQVFYGIEADLATYGKIVGGGMPIGVIAGRDPWMDALDGGQWQYGDDSIPTAGVTYFAGTFVRHPLAMVAAYTSLLRMKSEGPKLQERINANTTAMAGELNAFFKSVGAPLEIRHFASLWKTFFIEPQPYGELLFCYLRDRGVHIWDGFPCFLTEAHGQQEIDFIVRAFKEAVAEMQAGDFLPGVAAGTTGKAMDADFPPVPGARLGRDALGNPAWFISDPNQPGKYLQLT